MVHTLRIIKSFLYQLSTLSHHHGTYFENYKNVLVPMKIMHAITKKEADTMKYLLAGPVDKSSTGMTMFTFIAAICSVVYIFSGCVYYWYTQIYTYRSIVGRVFYFPLELCVRLIYVFAATMWETVLYILS